MKFFSTFLLAVAAAGLCRSASADDFPREKLDDAGFVSIFDGKTLAGWHISAETGHSGTSKNKSGGRWVVENGAITGSQDVPGNGGIVITDREYTNFEVIVEMNNDFGPDSGLFLRSNDKGQAYQYLVDYHSTGNIAGLYGEGLKPGFHIRNYSFTDKPSEIVPVNDSATPLPIKPADWPKFWKHGEWHQFRAKIVGHPPHITTWIDNVKFTDWQDDKTHEPLATKGGIALQVHGGGDFTKQFVRYRGVKVKELK
jgi:3-keto-disaccharide hydrolase